MLKPFLTVALHESGTRNALLGPLEDSKTHIWFLRQKVGERKLAVLMKKMKESGKLDINKRLTNHSARKFLLQPLRENNVEGRAIMQIGHTNVASINYYSKRVRKTTSKYQKSSATHSPRLIERGERMREVNGLKIFKEKIVV